jgi:shikimate kinase
MATGKTAVGKELAQRTKRQFIDLDELIEFKEKKRIADIFAQEGESYFRKREKLALKEVAAEKSFVVATGGGIVMDPENLRMMKATGKVICLSATPEVILQRTAETTHRPLLNVKEPRKQIELLLKLRAPYYALADARISTDKLSVKQVAEKIIALTKQKAKLKSKKRAKSRPTKKR